MWIQIQIQIRSAGGLLLCSKKVPTGARLPACPRNAFVSVGLDRDKTFSKHISMYLETSGNTIGTRLCLT